MKKHSPSHWALFNVIRERLLDGLLKSVEPGMFKEMLGIAPRRNRPRSEPQTANERYWTPWFWEVVEIHATLDRLDQILTYLSHYPGNKAFRGRSEADWLRYHIEFYLQEIYVLRERLRRFLKKVEKAAVDARDKSGVSATRVLKTGVELSLKNVVFIRAGHVHHYRFDDEELKKLDGIVLITNIRQFGVFRPLRELQYQKTMVKFRQQLRRNNREIRKLCVRVFEDTTKILVRNEPSGLPTLPR
jgi:hypothetical protein